MASTSVPDSLRLVPARRGRNWLVSGRYTPVHRERYLDHEGSELQSHSIAAAISSPWPRRPIGGSFVALARLSSPCASIASNEVDGLLDQRLGLDSSGP